MTSPLKVNSNKSIWLKRFLAYFSQEILGKKLKGLNTLYPLILDLQEKLSQLRQGPENFSSGVESMGEFI